MEGLVNVEVFSGPQCAHCERAKMMLDRNGIAYTEHDISVAESQAELARRLPRAKSVPQVFVAGEHIGNDEDLELLLRRVAEDSSC